MKIFTAIYDWLLKIYCRMEVEMFMEAQKHMDEIENIRFIRNQNSQNKSK